MPSTEALTRVDRSMPYEFLPKFVSFIRTHARGAKLIVDVGGGSGNLWNNLPELKNSVVPVDLVHRNKLKRRVAANAAQLPFKTSSLHRVVSAFTYEYSTTGMLREISRVLHPDGQAVLLFHHPQSAVIQTNAINNVALTHARKILEEIKKGKLDEYSMEEADNAIQKVHPVWERISSLSLPAARDSVNMIESSPVAMNNEMTIASNALKFAWVLTQMHKAGNYEPWREVVKARINEKLREVTHAQELTSKLTGPDSNVFSSSWQITRMLRSHGLQPTSIEEIQQHVAGKKVKAFAVVAKKLEKE